jgi:hypothetical protein
MHYQHERRGSHGHSPAIGSSSDGQQLYPAGAGSEAGGRNNFYSSQPGVQPHYGGGYPATAAQPQDLTAAVNEGTQKHGPWLLAPGVPPVGSHSKHTFDFVSFSGVSSDPIQGGFDPRLRTLLDIMRNTILSQKLPDSVLQALTVSHAIDFCLFLSLS